MPLRRFRQPLPELPPTERLLRAIRNIDMRLEHAQRSHQPLPFSAYQARRILQDALRRCRETRSTQTAAHRLHMETPAPSEPDTSAANATPQDFTGCRDATITTDFPPRECDRERHAYEGKSMAYDWTGEVTRKRNRLKLASVVFFSLVVVALPLAAVPFL